MRRTLAVVACVVALVGMLAPAAFAQAPAPKVTIVGLFDQVTSTGRNIYDGNFVRAGDSEWYARTRFRPDIIFEVGRTKSVLGLEIDLTYGQAGANDGGFPGNVSGTASGCKAGSNGCLDLNTDVGGMVEVKWIYTEFDLTGANSLLPFIPVPTVARAGGQPFGTLASYKIAYATGDFAGLSTVTTLAPNLKLAMAYVMVEDEITPGNRGRGAARGTRGNDFAFILSPEITVFKGFDIKPLYSYFQAEGITSGAARRGAVNRNSLGGNIAAAGSYQFPGNATPGGEPSLKEHRHTIGFDARWRSGPFSFDPTVYYQFGTYDSLTVPVAGAGPAGARLTEGDINALFVDLQGGFRVGPLLLEARGIYSTGNKARDNLATNKRYFEPLDTDTGYYAGWAQIMALGVDYFNGGGGALRGMSTNVGYDRYGRIQFGLRATYSVTPALSLYLIGSPTWTAEEVDTNTGVGGAIVNDDSYRNGDERWLGFEGNLGMTWRFAPNVAFDLVGAYLFAGSALDSVEVRNGVAEKREARDGWTTAARIRFAF